MVIIEDYKGFKRFTDFNYDIVDQKYDRLNIKKFKKIKRPITMYGAFFTTDPETGKINIRWDELT